MNKQKILITGGGGYIGSVAVYTFLQKGFDVLAIDNFVNGFKQPLEVLQKKFGKDRLRFYQLDIKDNLSPIFEKENNISAVVHFAALCSVDESMKQPEKYFINNVCGSLSLLNSVFKYKINKIIFSSTCAVYGEAKYIPLDEKHQCLPTNPYGESKLMVEKAIGWYGRIKNLNYVILRYFNVCGASSDGLIGDSKKPSIHLMQNAVRGVLSIEPFYLTCPDVKTPDKTPIRDYVDVVDLAEAHVLACEYLSKGGQSEIINLGTESGNSVLEIIKKIEEITGGSIKLDKTKARQGEYSKMIAATAKAKEILGWWPKRTIEQSVKSLIKWYKNQPRGWI